MSKKLFVGGLSRKTTNDGLRQAFEGFGNVTEATVIMDRVTGISRGFGFVTFANDQDGVSAINKMNGAVLDGWSIKVNEAKERGARDNRRGGGGHSSRDRSRQRW